MIPPNEFEATMWSGRTPTAVSAPVEAVGHYLVMLEGDEARRRVEIGTEAVTIGRDPQQTLAFADSELSRCHARAYVLQGHAIVEDLRSTNGTFLRGQRIAGCATLAPGDILRLGRQTIRYERQSRQAVERADALNLDLQRASAYVASLLPEPLVEGPVRTEWQFVPSAQLGGDAFGYGWLDADTFAFYLFDVSGHGVGSAMHSVTVLNVLRQHALPNVDFSDPASVLRRLNAMFDMSRHGGLFFTMWYGVYRVGARTLAYGSAGHHPAYLLPPAERTLVPLGQPSLMIGVAPDAEYDTGQTVVPAGAILHVFSDGVFEIVPRNSQQRWGIADLLPLLSEAGRAGTSPVNRIYDAVKDAAPAGPLDDDFSLLVLSFP